MRRGLHIHPPLGCCEQRRQFLHALTATSHLSPTIFVPRCSRRGESGTRQTSCRSECRVNEGQRGLGYGATQNAYLHYDGGLLSDAGRVSCNSCPQRPRRDHSLHSTTAEIDVLQSLPHTSRLIICATIPPLMRRRRQARRPQDRYTEPAALHACYAVCRPGPEVGVAGCVSRAVRLRRLSVRNVDAGTMSSCAKWMKTEFQVGNHDTRPLVPSYLWYFCFSVRRHALYRSRDDRRGDSGHIASAYCLESYLVFSSVL